MTHELNVKRALKVVAKAAESAEHAAEAANAAGKVNQANTWQALYLLAESAEYGLTLAWDGDFMKVHEVLDEYVKLSDTYEAEIKRARLMGGNAKACLDAGTDAWMMANAVMGLV